MRYQGFLYDRAGAFVESIRLDERFPVYRLLINPWPSDVVLAAYTPLGQALLSHYREFLFVAQQGDDFMYWEIPSACCARCRRRVA
jgi:hypothetical protein